MVMNVLRLVLAVNSISKALNRVEKIPICVVVYAARATRGHRFGGVPTTPKGRDLFLLALIFG